MYKFTALLIIALAFLQSCSPKVTLPSDLSKSLLLVEKLPTDSVVLNNKGKKEVVDKKVGGWVSMLNRRANAKTQKAFMKYPFAYKIVTVEQVGDNIDPSKTTYFLKNGISTKSAYVDFNSKTAMGNPKVKTKVKTKVVLENLTKSRKSTLGEVQGGVSGLSGKIVSTAVKMKKSSKSGKSKKR